MEKEKKGKGRPAYKVTQEHKSMIEKMAGMGMVQEHIAAIIGCSVDTLHKYYSDVMAVGKGKANFKVAESLYNNATKNNNVVAQVFWMKTQAKWKETDKLEITGKDDGPVEISEAKSMLLSGIIKDEEK